MISLRDILPIPATHEPGKCTCRACGDSAYSDLLLRADYQRQELSRQADEIKSLRKQVAIARFRYLTLVIEKAVAAKDEATWAAATSERLELPVSFWEVES